MSIHYIQKFRIIKVHTQDIWIQFPIEVYFHIEKSIELLHKKMKSTMVKSRLIVDQHIQEDINSIKGKRRDLDHTWVWSCPKTRTRLYSEPNTRSSAAL